MTSEALPLDRIPLFAGLDDRDLGRVAAAAHRRCYPRDHFLLVEGERCTAVYFVARGRVRVSKVSPEGREQVLALIGPGEGLNLVPAFDGGPNPASAQALMEVEAYAMAGADFRRLVQEVPPLARNILVEFSGKLRALIGLVEDLSFRTVEARLARFLLYREGLVPGRRWTQEEVAAHLGTVREMVGRVLRAWQSQGVVRLEKGRVVVLDRTTLEEKLCP